MKHLKIVYFISALSLTSSCLYGAPPKITLISNATTSPMQTNQVLLDALIALGCPVESVAAFHASGETSSALTASFSRYANNRNSSQYGNLSPSESNALILFGFMLVSDRKIPEPTMDTLMSAEKQRLGMNNSQIKELERLSSMIQKDPSFALSNEEIGFIYSILPYIRQNPFAFADVLGPLISAFLSKENDDEEDTSSDIYDTLTDAAQEISSLSSDQVTTINFITNEYTETNQFTASTENVDAVNQAMAMSFLPFGLYALYPILGSEDVYAVGDVTRVYAGDFNQVYVDRYNGEVARNQAAENQRKNALKERKNSNTSPRRDQESMKNKENKRAGKDIQNKSLDRSRSRGGRSGSRGGGRR